MCFNSSTTVQAPATPAAPTTAQNMSDYVNNYPAMIATVNMMLLHKWPPRFTASPLLRMPKSN